MVCERYRNGNWAGEAVRASPRLSFADFSSLAPEKGLTRPHPGNGAAEALDKPKKDGKVRFVGSPATKIPTSTSKCWIPVSLSMREEAASWCARAREARRKLCAMR